MQIIIIILHCTVFLTLLDIWHHGINISELENKIFKSKKILITYYNFTDHFALPFLPLLIFPFCFWHFL